MTGDLEVPNITVPGDIVVDNGSQIKSGSDMSSPLVGQALVISARLMFLTI